MATGLLVIAVPCLLLATQPAHQTYWAQMFPAIALSSLCSDFVYVAAQTIASNSVGHRQQGIAGSLMSTLNLYGSSLGVGFAGTIEAQVRKYPGADSVLGYRAALYFGFALAMVGLVIVLIFVRMSKDEREG
jgi:MFS family permease